MTQMEKGLRAEFYPDHPSILTILILTFYVFQLFHHRMPQPVVAQARYADQFAQSYCGAVVLCDGDCDYFFRDEL